MAVVQTAIDITRHVERLMHEKLVNAKSLHVGVMWEFEDYSRAYGDGLRKVEPWSSDEDDTRAGTPS
ncbi:hypothetical protein TNCV_3250181 [Trichonephila clavipes]|nr:hypothetical protein TNCV_3250181 [Trichonephila clavipes]